MLICQGQDNFKDSWLDDFNASVSAFPSLAGRVLAGLKTTGASILHPLDQ